MARFPVVQLKQPSGPMSMTWFFSRQIPRTIAWYRNWLRYVTPFFGICVTLASVSISTLVKRRRSLFFAVMGPVGLDESQKWITTARCSSQLQELTCGWSVSTNTSGPSWGMCEACGERLRFGATFVKPCFVGFVGWCWFVVVVEHFIYLYIYIYILLLYRLSVHLL